MQLKLATALAFAFISLSACGPSTSASDVTRHTEGHGPLSASAESGGKGLYAPKNAKNWDATFGGLILCSTTGQPLEITGVDYDFIEKPKSAEFLVRTVPPAADRPESSSMGAWAPITGRVGAPNDFFYPPRKFGGELSQAVGATITNGCGGTPEDSFTELLTVWHVGGGGASAKDVRVAYTSGERKYELSVNWEYWACGHAVDPDKCE